MYDLNNASLRICSSQIYKFNEHTVYVTFGLQLLNNKTLYDGRTYSYEMYLANLVDKKYENRLENLKTLGWNGSIYLGSDIVSGFIRENIFLEKNRLIPGRPTRASLVISNEGYSDVPTPAYNIFSKQMYFDFDLFASNQFKVTQAQYKFIALTEQLPFTFVPPQVTYKIDFTIYPNNIGVRAGKVSFAKLFSLPDESYFNEENADNYRPFDIKSDTAWAIVYQNIKRCYGTSVSSVYSSYLSILDTMHVLNQASRSLSVILRYVIDLNDGKSIEYASLVDEQDLKIVDQIRLFPYLDSIDRSYSSFVSNRKLSGMFGLGWSNKWYDSINRTIDGLVNNFVYYEDSSKLASQSWKDNFENSLTIYFSEACASDIIVKIEFVYLTRTTRVLYEYDDKCEMLLKVTNEQTNTTFEYEYDAFLDLIARKDSIGNVATFAYDEQTRLIKKISTYTNDNQLVSEKEILVDCKGMTSVRDTISNESYSYLLNADRHLIFHQIDSLNETFQNRVFKVRSEKKNNLMCSSYENGAQQQMYFSDCFNSNGTLNVFMNAVGDQIVHEFDPNTLEMISFRDGNNNKYEFYQNDTKNIESNETVIYPDGRSRSLVRFANYSGAKKLIDLDKSEYSFVESRTNFSLHRSKILTATERAFHLSFILEENYKYVNVTNHHWYHVIDDKLKIEYDAKLRPVEVEYPNGVRLFYEYNKYDQRTKLTTNNGYNLIYMYDQLNRLATLVSNDKILAKLEYNSVSLLKSIQFSNNMSTYFDYYNADMAYLLKSKRTIDSRGSLIDYYNLTYDELGQIASVLSKENEYLFEYDRLKQLVTWKISKTGSSEQVISSKRFEFDSNSNRKLLFDLLNNQTIKYESDAMNRYVNTNIGKLEFLILRG